jgi:hypothetical protein
VRSEAESIKKKKKEKLKSKAEWCRMREMVGKASLLFGRLIGIASSRRRMMEHLFKKKKKKYRAARERSSLVYLFLSFIFQVTEKTFSLTFVNLTS